METRDREPPNGPHDVPDELPPDSLRHARHGGGRAPPCVSGAIRTIPTAGGFSASGARRRARSSTIRAGCSILLRARRGEDARRRVSWDDALDLVAGRMQAVGREAVGLWSGHGLFANNYGTRIGSHLLRRFANLWGCQWWHPSMICWGLGGFGLGLTGVLEANTKEDMGAHAPHPAVGRQPCQPAQHGAASYLGPAAGLTSSRSTCERQRRQANPTSSS